MPKGMILTDLDGPLLNSAGKISEENLAMLLELGRQNVVRVAATGRNLHSARQVVDHSLPFDYLIFSTGAGISAFADDKILCAHELPAHYIQALAKFFIASSVDFSIHHPIPDNHLFHWFAAPQPTSDLLTRLAHLKDFASQGPYELINRATQFLAISLDGLGIIAELQNLFPHLSIIRTTSPLDRTHVWIEVFPAAASKGHAARWLCNELGIDKRNTMSIGNDYNDLAMLEWTAHGYVVANGPEDLRRRFSPAPANDEHGFAAAAKLWLTELSS